jgi:hypothetical protein
VLEPEPALVLVQALVPVLVQALAQVPVQVLELALVLP